MLLRHDANSSTFAKPLVVALFLIGAYLFCAWPRSSFRCSCATKSCWISLETPTQENKPNNWSTTQSNLHVWYNKIYKRGPHDSIILSLLTTGVAKSHKKNLNTTTKSFPLTARHSRAFYNTGYRQRTRLEWILECFQEENDCSGESCSWDVSNLPSYLTNEDCSQASSCSIGGATIQECKTPT